MGSLAHFMGLGENYHSANIADKVMICGWLESAQVV